MIYNNNISHIRKGKIKMEKEAAIKSKKQKKVNLKSSVNDIVMISLFSALIAVCSQICIPTPPKFPPVTMQTFAIFLAGSMLGWKKGTLSVLVYIILGIIGIPVFAQLQSGIGVLFGMTGGYIIGFLLTAFITGLICEKLGKKLWVLIVSMISGLLLCYAFGTVWFMVVYGQQVGQISFWSALCICIFPFLIFDAGKIAIASVAVNRLDKVVKL